MKMILLPMYETKVRIFLKSVAYPIFWNNIQHMINVTHFIMEILRNRYPYFH